jgi:hypothetical protein
MDGAKSGDQLLFLDGVFGNAGTIWDVGRDSDVIDFGSGNFWRVVGWRVVAGDSAAGGDETFAVSGGALGWFDEPERDRKFKGKVNDARLKIKQAAATNSTTERENGRHHLAQAGLPVTLTLLMG